MNGCMLCLNKTLKKNSIKIDTKNECDSTVEEIIKLHFWFSESILTSNIATKQPIICKTCWNKLESFHEFFCAVKFNHKIPDPEQSVQFAEIFVKNESLDPDMTIMTVKAATDDENDFIDDLFSPDKEINSESDEPKPRKSGRKRKAVNRAEVVEKKEERREEKKNRFVWDVDPEEMDVLRVHTDFKCEICSQSMNRWKEIRAHYRQAHNTSGYIRCCGRKFDRPSEVKDHVNWHLNPNIFQCHICGKSSISRDNLKLHEETHIPAEARQYSCPKCDKKFVNRYNLNMHSKVHEKDGLLPTIPCKFCDKFYKTERQLRDHFNYSHKSQEAFICHICSKVLKSRYTLDIHVKAHTDPDNPITCDLCGHILKNKRRFAIHMAKHKSAEAGPYACEKGCGKMFKHRSAMLDHIAFVHTKNRFNCSFCGKEFKHKKPLEEHEATQHGGLDLYSCPFCERTFKSNANMHAHKKKAHPEEYKNLPAPSYLKGTLGDYC